MVDPIVVKRSQARDGDILCCRGNGVLSHPGNVFYLQLIKKYQKMYQSRDQLLTAKEKRVIVRHIVDVIESLDPPGRFLKLVGRNPNESEDVFHVIQDKDTRMKKVSQALRERPKKSALSKEAKEDGPKQLKLLQHFNGGVQKNSTSNLREDNCNTLYTHPGANINLNASTNQSFPSTTMINSKFMGQLPEQPSAGGTNTFSSPTTATTNNNYPYHQYQNLHQHHPQQQQQQQHHHQLYNNYHFPEKTTSGSLNLETVTEKNVQSDQEDNIHKNIQKISSALQHQSSSSSSNSSSNSCNNIQAAPSALQSIHSQDEESQIKDKEESNESQEDCSYYHFSELKRGKIVQEKWFIHLKDNKICPIEPGNIVNPDHLVMNNLNQFPKSKEQNHDIFRMAHQKATESNRNQGMNEAITKDSLLDKVKSQDMQEISQEDFNKQTSIDFQRSSNIYARKPCRKRDFIALQQDSAQQKEEGIGLGVALLLNLGTPNVSSRTEGGTSFQVPQKNDSYYEGSRQTRKQDILLKSED